MAQANHEIDYLVNEIAVNNSEQAYKRLFTLLFARLNRFAYSILKCNELAEEVASDVMITIWRNRGNLLSIQNITVYAFVVAKNKSLNMLKQNNQAKLISIDDIEFDVSFDNLTPEQILINGELKKKIEGAVQSLPPKCKSVFKLIKEDGLSYKEVAEILNISIKTVDAQMVTATRKICLIVRAEYNLI
ncbi:sigma-70 family RNA polymerase sigma factor [Mucilaginibacter sp. HMF5004]|uniref:RNA polymerase sigma factor n=1 Tax=Mucilaginibacter rivuli TaxID=2857527 RepID=UPI001C600C30|nr:sigma-70 family RNA polymerase sigma factor [Mucilaginibacter rivuli]MBW4889237.1 sigma-70 family RNA polymerase sigma factor [Mucilaginibacter rivuli]